MKSLPGFAALNRKKTDPSKYFFTGTKAGSELDIQLFQYNLDECIEVKDLKPLEVKPFQEDKYFYWLNIYGLKDPEVIAAICQNLNIHSLVIQDILDLNQRPKYQDFESNLFLTIKSILKFNSEINSEQISFVLGKNYIVSFQERKADYFEHIRFRLRENKGIIRSRNTDYLLYTLLEAILDNYFKSIEILDADVDKISFFDPRSEPSPDVLIKAENYKKYAHYMKKAILPIKEFCQYVERKESQFVDKKHLKYYLEIKDLCMTLLDNCDMIHSSLESITNLFFSIQGHRMNQVMKTLTIVATIFIPLTFVAGIYGMNFYNMPELEWKYGYLSVWIVISIIFFSMVVYFRKKKWF